MDIRHMRYVLAVADHGNVRRAAATVHITPQSLSERVQTAEREVGAPLFERSRRGMVLTAVGEVFVAHASLAVDAADRVVRASRAAAAEPLTTPVRIGVAGGLGELLRDILGRLLTLRPNVALQVTDLRSVDQCAAIRDGNLTAGIAYAPLSDQERRGLSQHRLRADPVRALLPADHHSARDSVVSLRTLASLPLLLPTTNDAPGLRRHLIDIVTAAGIEPSLGPAVYGHEMAIALVAAGQGYTLCVPERPGNAAEGVVFRPLADAAPPTRTILLTRQGDPRPEIADLTRIARDVARYAPTATHGG